MNSNRLICDLIWKKRKNSPVTHRCSVYANEHGVLFYDTGVHHVSTFFDETRLPVSLEQALEWNNHSRFSERAYARMNMDVYRSLRSALRYNPENESHFIERSNANKEETI